MNLIATHTAFWLYKDVKTLANTEKTAVEP